MRKMSLKNVAKEETASRSYTWFILALLVKSGGRLRKEKIYEAIEDAYGYTFGPEDLKKIGKGGRPKWMNSVDWCKAVLTKQKETISLKGELILTDSATPDELRQASKRKKSFKRRCKNPRCRALNKLARKVCRKCLNPFPLPNQRVYREPRIPR